MSSRLPILPDRNGRRLKRAAAPSIEALEGRVVLSTVHKLDVLGTITGQVTNAQTHVGVKGVKIELINESGKIAQTTKTNAQGNYAFHVTKAGPYVVHEVVPKGHRQVTPTVSNVAPIGSYIPGTGSKSWNYVSTNGIPSVGPVGPAYWADIAPAGKLPFQSPININTRTMKAVNLDTVLHVNYHTSTPTTIVNNSHQIQVQYKPRQPDGLHHLGRDRVQPRPVPLPLPVRDDDQRQGADPRTPLRQHVRDGRRVGGRGPLQARGSQ